MPEPAATKLAYNLREAQDALGVKRTTLLKHLREGAIPYYRLPAPAGRRYIRADDLAAFVDRASGRREAA